MAKRSIDSRDRRISGPMHDQVIRVIRAGTINGDGRDISSGDSDSKMLFICLLPPHVIHLCPAALNSLEIVNGPLLVTESSAISCAKECAIESKYHQFLEFWPTMKCKNPSSYRHCCKIQIGDLQSPNSH